MIFVLSILFCLTIHAQENSKNEEEFIRKGRVLLELGYETQFFNVGGGNTGLTIAVPTGEGNGTFTSLGLEGGYFVTNDLAIKLRFSLINVSDFSDFTLTTFALGGKYYLGKVPLEFNLGLINGFEETGFFISPQIGYAFSLAQNIYLKPFAGVTLGDEDFFGDEQLFQFGLAFSLFL